MQGILDCILEVSRWWKSSSLCESGMQMESCETLYQVLKLLQLHECMIDR